MAYNQVVFSTATGGVSTACSGLTGLSGKGTNELSPEDESGSTMTSPSFTSDTTTTNRSSFWNAYDQPIGDRPVIVNTSFSSSPSRHFNDSIDTPYPFKPNSPPPNCYSPVAHSLIPPPFNSGFDQQHYIHPRQLDFDIITDRPKLTELEGSMMGRLPDTDAHKLLSFSARNSEDECQLVTDGRPPVHSILAQLGSHNRHDIPNFPSTTTDALSVWTTSSLVEKISDNIDYRLGNDSNPQPVINDPKHTPPDVNNGYSKIQNQNDEFKERVGKSPINAGINHPELATSSTTSALALKNASNLTNDNKLFSSANTYNSKPCENSDPTPVSAFSAYNLGRSLTQNLPPYMPNSLTPRFPITQPPPLPSTLHGRQPGIPPNRPVIRTTGPPLPPSMVHHHSFGFNHHHLEGSRRKNATRESTTTLKVWLQEHIKNPYPTKGEKIMLAIITKMTLTQVSTWFANARRRLKKENKMSWHPKTTTGSNNSNKNQFNNSSSPTHDSCDESGDEQQEDGYKTSEDAATDDFNEDSDGEEEDAAMTDNLGDKYNDSYRGVGNNGHPNLQHQPINLFGADPPMNQTFNNRIEQHNPTLHYMDAGVQPPSHHHQDRIGLIGTDLSKESVPNHRMDYMSSPIITHNFNHWSTTISNLPYTRSYNSDSTAFNSDAGFANNNQHSVDLYYNHPQHQQQPGPSNIDYPDTSGLTPSKPNFNTTTIINGLYDPLFYTTGTGTSTNSAGSGSSSSSSGTSFAGGRGLGEFDDVVPGETVSSHIGRLIQFSRQVEQERQHATS